MDSAMRWAGRVVLSSCLLLGSAIGAWALPVDYLGQWVNGASSTGGAWSYGHTATSSPMTPPGGFLQHAGGTVIYAMDPTPSAVLFSYDDTDSNGLDAGDKISLNNATINILDYSGNIFGSHTLLGVIGTLKLNGTVTVVTGPHSTGSATTIRGTTYTHGLTGDLDYEFHFTATPSHNPGGFYNSGDTFTGTGHFQAAAFSTVFNGIRRDPPDPPFIEFALWGSNRGPGGVVGAKKNNVTTTREFGLDIVINGEEIPAITIVPEPGTLLLLGSSLLALAAGGWRRRRRK